MNEKIITDFNEKSNLFNKYFSSTMMKKPIFLTNIFSSQCNPLPNDSKLPETYITELNYHLSILGMKIHTK